MNDKQTFKPRTFAETLEAICHQKGGNLIKNNKVSQAAASEYFKIPQPYFYRWLKTGTQPREDAVKQIAKKLKLSPAQVRGEEPIQGIDYTETPGIREQAPGYLTHQELRSRVPLISAIRAGNWTEAIDNLHTGDAEAWIETTAKVGDRAFALKVEGDSMANPYGTPSIPEGAIVIIDPDTEATNGKIVVAKLTDSNEVTLKKLVIDGPNKYLKPLNPDYKAIQINGNCTIIGVARRLELEL